MRNYKIDNYKTILTFLVVLGHVLVFMRVENFNYFLNLIYSFHMPAFIFINGLLFKKINIKKNIKLFIILVIMQIIYIIYFKFIGYYPSVGISTFLTPAFHLWYIFAYIIWSIAAKMIDSFKSNKYIFNLLVIISIMLSLGVRFLNLPIGDQFLSYTRILVFFPFFLIGFYSKSIIKQMNNFELDRKKAAFTFIFLMIVVVLLTFSKLTPNPELFFGFRHIQDFELTKLSFFILEIIQFIVAIGLIISTYIMCSNSNNKFTHLTKNVTFIYLFHPFLVSLLIKINFDQYSLIINTFFSLIISIIIFIFLSELQNYIKKLRQ